MRHVLTSEETQADGLLHNGVFVVGGTGCNHEQVVVHKGLQRRDNKPGLGKY